MGRRPTACFGPACVISLLVVVLAGVAAASEGQAAELFKVGNLNIYSENKDSADMTIYNVKHHALIPSRLTAAEQRLSQPRHKLPESTWPQPGKRAADPEPKDVKVVIGIYTAPTAPGTEPRSKYDYNYRRQLAREMWISRARRYSHVVVKFLVGINPDPVKHASMLDEQEKYGDIMIVQMNDTYSGLTDKTRHFFQKVFRSYPNVEWVVKMDDDVYLLPERLLQAADQWAAAGADYIGCFSTGPTYPDPSHRWYEPNALQIGPMYAWRAQGPIYVLSRRVVRDVVVRRFDHLRLSGSAEDSSTGVWMLGSNAVALEEKRLCMTVCNEATVGVCDTWDQGLQLRFWHAVHADPGCANEPAWPMPYVRAYDGRMVRTQRILI